MKWILIGALTLLGSVAAAVGFGVFLIWATHDEQFRHYEPKFLQK